MTTGASTAISTEDRTAGPLQEHTCANTAAQARQLAEAVATQLRHAIATRGHALLAVSGGKSPIALLEHLRRQPLDWTSVTVLLVDERCVPHTHPDSNTALVRQHLLQDEAAAATFVTFFDALDAELPANLSTTASSGAAQQAAAPGTASADAMPLLDTLAAAANQRLAALHWPLDVAVLGMGEDGHTASLFPAAPGLDTALHTTAHVAWVRPDAIGHAPHPRLTLTLPTLQAARQLHLSLAGPAKQAVYRQALAQPDAALPVSLLLHRPAHPFSVWLA